MEYTLFKIRYRFHFLSRLFLKLVSHVLIVCKNLFRLNHPSLLPLFHPLEPNTAYQYFFFRLTIITFIKTFVMPPVLDTEIFVIPAALDEKSSKWLVLIKTLSLNYDAVVASQLQWKSAIIQIIIANSFNCPYNVFIMLIMSFKCCVFIIYACAFACILAVQDLRQL